MKKLFLLFLVINLGQIASSQTYREAFDKSDYAFNNGQGNSFYCNAGLSGCSSIPLDGEADLLHSYLVMYRATRDKRYLDKFIIHAKRVQERRDDNIQNIANYVANHTHCQSISPVPNNPLSKGWSYDQKWDGSNVTCCQGWMPTTLYSGKITFPMAEFVYMMKIEFAGDADVINMSLPQEANGVNQYIDQYNATYNISEGFTDISTYSNFADWLYERLKQTIDYHNTISWQTGTNNLCNYDNSITFGAYCSNGENCGSNGISAIADPNQQCAIGKTLAYMYLASMVYNSSSYTNMFHDRVVNIAKGLWCQLNTSLTSSPPLPSNLPQASEGYWAWCHQFNCNNSQWEDIGHGIEEAQFLELCHRYQITDFSNNLLFSTNTMLKMANTLAYKIYKSPLQYAGFVDGSGSEFSGVGYWGFLTPYNPYIYQELSDIFSYHSIYSPEAPLQTAYLALAQSPYYQSNTESQTNYKFNPVAVRRGHSLGSSVYALASGDFDANGKTDFISVDDQNGIFYVYTPDFSCDPNSSSTCWTITPTNSHGTVIWSGIAAGNYNSNHAGDEFIALNRNTGNIHYFEQNGNSFNEQTLASPSGSPWAWITAWNFDNNNPGDEAIAIPTNVKF